MEKIKHRFALFLIYLFNMLPIKNNKIFFFSYYGAQYGCNPKYITNYIINHYPKEKFDIVWAFNDPKFKINMKAFRKVKTMSIRYIYELCTSKVIITNFRTTNLFKKRKNQYYIQTWHSSLRLKQIEKDIEKSLPVHYLEMAKQDSLKCDLLLSGCEFSTKIFQRAFWYSGEIFEHGTPRNDALLQDNQLQREKILKKLNIATDTKILLYAPTFRKDNNLDVYDLNYKQIKKQITNKFGGKWLILVKLHPHLLAVSDKLTENDFIINVTTYDDIQELLLVADLLISDYSSLIFDYAITGRPCILYTPDLEEYKKKERDLYFNISDLPFIHTMSNDELLTKIEKFNSVEYKEKIREFLQGVGTFEEGKASKYLLKRIENVCFEEGRDYVNEAI